MKEKDYLSAACAMILMLIALSAAHAEVLYESTSLNASGGTLNATSWPTLNDGLILVDDITVPEGGWTIDIVSNFFGTIGSPIVGTAYLVVFSQSLGEVNPTLYATEVPVTLTMETFTDPENGFERETNRLDASGLDLALQAGDYWIGLSPICDSYTNSWMAWGSRISNDERPILYDVAGEDWTNLYAFWTGPDEMLRIHGETGINNVPPVVAIPFDDITLNEDFNSHTISLTGHFTDVDTPTLTYSVTSGSTQVTANITGDAILLSSVADWNGPAAITVIASDGISSVSDDFQLTVTPINDAPIVAVPFENIAMDENFETFTIALAGHFTDVDNDNLAYSVVFDDEQVSVAVENGNLVFNAVADWFGETTISVTADDGAADTRNNSLNRLSVTDTFVITVNEVGIDDHNTPVDAANMISNYPNPFNPETTISYTLPQDDRVRIDIYNIKGQKVKSLLDEKVAQGRHQVVWNGTGEHGVLSASGIYFCHVQAGDQIVIGKMLLLK
jgi:hypothetical protein